MAEKVKVEFINTCACCDAHGETIKKVAARFGDAVDVSIYHAGRDFEYLKKYGLITRGTMIVNGTQKYEDLSGENIEKAITRAMET